MLRVNHLLVATVTITLLLLAGGSAFADVELYMQPPIFNGNFWASQNDVGGFGNFATVYDSFQIYSHTTAYRLDDVEWFGGYFNPGPPGSITGWTISLYADNAGQPGGVIWSRFFSVAYRGYMESCTYPDNTCGYDMNAITHGYLLMPNTTYWLSLVPDLKFPPQWGWAESNMGGDTAYQDFFGSRSPLGVNLAFNVQGVPTPEPGTLILLGTGILGLASTLRRKLF